MTQILDCWSWEQYLSEKKSSNPWVWLLSLVGNQNLIISNCWDIRKTLKLKYKVNFSSETQKNQTWEWNTQKWKAEFHVYFNRPSARKYTERKIYLLKSIHFKKIFERFLSNVLSFLLTLFWFQKKWQHFLKKWGLRNCLLKMHNWMKYFLYIPSSIELGVYRSDLIFTHLRFHEIFEKYLMKPQSKKIKTQCSFWNDFNSLCYES